MTTLSVCAYMTISTHTHVYIYFKILTLFRIETAIVGISACVLVLTMIYDNKNFIVDLALHASRIEKERRSERERESIAIRKLHIYRCKICCIFPMKNPLLAIDTKFTIYKLYKLHSNRSRFSDDFPTISFARQLPVASLPLIHSRDIIAGGGGGGAADVGGGAAAADAVCHCCCNVRTSFFGLFSHCITVRAIIVVVIVDVVYFVQPLRERSVHFLETNFGVSVLKLFPYVMI